MEHAFLNNVPTSWNCDELPSFSYLVVAMSDRQLYSSVHLWDLLCRDGGQELRHWEVSRGAMATARSVVSCQVSTLGNGGEAFDSSSDQRSSPSITSPCQPIGEFSEVHLNSPKDHRQNRCQLKSNFGILFPSICTHHTQTHCGNGRYLEVSGKTLNKNHTRF